MSLKYANRYFVKKDPVEVTFFVTSQCELRCKHCCNWKNLDSLDLKSELSLGEIEAISRSMKPFLRLLLSGGEPFMRQDVSAICHAFYRNNKVKYITIPTNAFNTNRIVDSTEQIVTKCKDAFVNIGLSLDGLGEQRDEIMGVKGTFSRFEETYQALMDLKLRHVNLAVGIITTQTPDNEQSARQIIDYALSKPMIDNISYSLVRGITRNGAEMEVDIHQYKAMTKLILASGRKASRMSFPYAKLFRARRKLIYETVAKTYEEKRWQMPCYAGRLRVVINQQGIVYPCETLMFDGKTNALGSLREANYDFMDIWHSPEARQMRDKITGEKCFCRHECDVAINTLFNLRLLPRLLVGAIGNK